MRIRSRHALVLLALLAASADACQVADVSARITRARWVDACGNGKCMQLKGAAILESRCQEPARVKVRLDGLDQSGEVIATVEMWAFGMRTVGAGAYPFALDNWLDFDPAVVTFGVVPVEVRSE